MNKAQLKLEWIPLYISRIKGSARYRAMKDYQQGWYFNLLLEAVDSEMPGYLPANGQLWRLANSRSERFFQQESGPVMACFKSRQIDGCDWIYNERLLKTYEEQIQKVENKDSRKKVKNALICSLDSGLVLSIYYDYPRKEGRTNALKAIKKAVSDYAVEEKVSELDAAQYIHAAVIEFAKSPAGKNNGLFATYSPPHPATWFNGGRYRDDRKHWYTEKVQTGPHNPGVFKPEEKVMQACWGCKKKFDPDTRDGIFCADDCETRYDKHVAELKTQAAKS